MAVHNAELFLREAVESILGQTFSDLELLVVDDGSTDSTKRILSQYSDPRLRIIGFLENRGLVDALNFGIQEARGALIARMDGDDVSEPSRLEKQVAFMRANPGVVLLGTGFVWMDVGGRIFEETRMPTENMVLQERLLCGNQFCHSSVMIRVDAVRSVGNYRAVAGHGAEDYDLWLRLAEYGHIANLSDLLLRYRVHEGQVSIRRLADQRLTTNIFRALALQRRVGAEENLEEARRSSECSDVEMLRAIRADYLNWASRYFGMGRPAMATALLFKVLRLAPTDWGNWRELWRHLAKALMSSHGGRRLRWYFKRLSKLVPF